MYVDFTLADIGPHPSGSPIDKGVRTSRATTPLSSSGSRRSFPAVLQGFRADERRMEAREAAEARSANKSDSVARSRETKERNPPSTQAERAEVRSTNRASREFRPKETNGRNPSSTQTERAEVRSTNKSDRGFRSMEIRDQNPPATQTERANASPSEAQVQVQNGSRSSDDAQKGAEDSRNFFDATVQPSQPSVDSQGQTPILLVSLVPPLVVAQANDQTNVPTEGEEHFSYGESVSERETESDDGSSQPPLISLRGANSALTASDLPEDQAHSDIEPSSPHDRPAHEPAAPVMHAGGDSHKTHVVKPGSHMVADDAGPGVANRVETRPVPLESQSGSALPQPEAIVRRVSPASLGVGLPDGKSDIPKTDSVIRDGVSADRSAPAQMNWYAQSLRDAQDSGVRTPWGFQQGQHLSVDGAERFSELWGDQQGRQHDPNEMKLPQAMVSDRQVSGGPATESLVAGAQGRVVSSPPPPPAPAVVSPPPSMPTHDTAESSVRFMTRSVVFDVAQPDLGHVNIRVAMTNDVVHTHLSADRLEVGQFLVNGQDRLQAAFQANGLDMGQFRVDIDRQSAGRSFQQDSSQEQGHSWNQGSQGMKWEHSPDRQDEPRTSLHGLLNVVA